MSLRIKLVILTVLIIFLFPQRVRAEELYYLVNKDSEDSFVFESLNIVSDFEPAERAFILYQNLLDNENESFIPEGTEIISTTVSDNHLILNVSVEILNYGGTYHERCLTSELLKNASALDGINKFSLLIDGKIEFLPEGSIIHELPLY